MLIHGLLEMLRLIELVRFLLGSIVYQLSDSSVIGRVKEDLTYNYYIHQPSGRSKVGRINVILI